MNDLGLGNTWLTLNRQCNLRCEWCYASSTQYKLTDDMSLADVVKVLDLSAKIGIKGITLLGGEPTCYAYLSDVLKLCKERNLKNRIVTNGIKLSDKAYLLELLNSGLDGVGLSLKAKDSCEYKINTKVDAFDAVMQAIDNLKSLDITFTVSIVISPNNVDNFIEGILSAKKAGAQHFTLSFLYDFSKLAEPQDKEYDFQKNIFNVVDSFESQYDRLCEVTNNHFTVMQIYPLCVWSQDFIYKLSQKKQMHSVCQLLRHRGLLFDPNLNIIPCNAMYEIKLGKYEEDFNTIENFTKFWNSEKIKKFFDRVSCVPSIECNNCNLLDICGGGCLANWFNFSFQELKAAIKNRKKLIGK